MGGVDKGLISVNDRPMIAWVIDELRPQVADLLISANRNRDNYAEFGYPVIDDGDDEFPETSVQTVELQSGAGAANVIPAEACAEFNLRYSPKWTFRALQDAIEAVVKSHA